MLDGLTVSKLSPYRSIGKSIIALILIIGMVSYFYREGIPFGIPSENPEGFSSANPAGFSQTTIPLLLNSGEVQTREAEVSIVLWFENGDIPDRTWTNLPTMDWKWTYNELQTGPENIAITLSGHQLINKNEEIDLFKWYTNMQQEFARTGGLIYIDERVDQAMDISAYLSKTNALPAQWALIGNMVSIAAYQNNFMTSVLAGQDRINIQLLSRGKNNERRTVLAIPALLQEF